MDREDFDPTSSPPQSQKFELLVNSVVNYAIYMLDLDGNVVSWNPGAARIKGYQAAEIIGQHYSRFFTPEDRLSGKPARALQQALDTGRYEEEGWRVRKDGEMFWALAVLDAVRDERGQLVGYAKVTRDMTERRAAQEALRASERSFRLLVDAVIDYAIYMLDLDGVVTNWNSGAERIKGYRADEIVGRRYDCFFTDEDRAAGLPDRELALTAEHGRYETEGWRVRKDGSRFWASIVIDAVRDEDGQLIGFAKVTRDMTERRQAQIELDRAQDALRQAQKMQALGHLTGGVAHDFNNLLTIISNNLQILRADATGGLRHSPEIDAAMQAIKRGADLVRQMLIFARKRALDVAPIPLPPLIAEMVLLVRHGFPANITITTDIAADLPAVESEASQLQSSLLNIANNAREAMPEGGRLHISARLVDTLPVPSAALPPGRYVCITLEDSGIGMDAATRQQAFEPFFTTRAASGGSGLGLSMVLGAVQQMGGDVLLESEPGEGTRVHLLLRPAEMAAASPPVDTVEPIEPAAGSILYVEDDILVAMSTQRILEDAGFAVRHAASAQRALEIMDAGHQIDILVSDIGLPGMNGYELAERLRRRQPGLGVIFVTGYDRFGSLDLPTDERTDHIDKPFESEQLIAAIARVQAAVRAG